MKSQTAAVSHAKNPAPSLADHRIGKVLNLIEHDKREGTQFSLYGIRGMPLEGLDGCSAENLFQIEKSLEPKFLGNASDRLALIHIEGLTFEIVSRQEADMYRADRAIESRKPAHKIIPHIKKLPKVMSALEDAVVIGGRSSQEAVTAITQLLGTDPYSSFHQRFASSETFVKLPESIRGKNVILVQTILGNADTAVASTEYMLDALSRASANSITLAMPYLPYDRQDRRGPERTAVTPTALFSKFAACGRGRLRQIVTIDIHSLQSEGMSGNINVENLSGASLFIQPLKRYLGDREFAVVFPDSGARKRAEDDRFDEKLERAFKTVPKIGSMAKGRNKEKTVSRSHFEGDPDIIKDKVVVLFDDMLDTGGTAVKSIQELYKLGAKSVIFCAAHPIFSQGAVEFFRGATHEHHGCTKPLIEKLFVCDTIPLRRACGDLIEKVSVYPLLAHFLAGVVSNGGFSTRKLAELYSGLT